MTDETQKLRNSKTQRLRRTEGVITVIGVLMIGVGVVWSQQRDVVLSPAALSTVRRMAIQHNGRHKPFDSFAWETLKLITGSPRIDREDPVATICAIMAEPEAWQVRPLIAVPFRPLRERLGMDPKASRISYNELIATRKLMRMLPAIVQKQQRDEKLTMLEQETMDVYERFVVLSALFEQRVVLVPPPTSSTQEWSEVFEASGYPRDQQEAIRNAWTSWLASVRGQGAASPEAAARQLAQVLRSANPAAYPASWRLHLEVLYNQSKPFRAARVFYLAACLMMLLSLSGARTRLGTIGQTLLLAAFVVHGAGIATRVVLGGRPPVSNFYETMLWLPFVAVGLSLVFERFSPVRYFSLSASMLAAIMLVLADVVPLDSSVAPVVAVLRSNLWLTIHVLTIVASYGALALATILAHFYAWTYLTGRNNAQQALTTLGDALYRVIQVGVVLLAGGIMLGAVWANASWGRYWGWDPKETWALITLLWFIALLHGRLAERHRDRRSHDRGILPAVDDVLWREFLPGGPAQLCRRARQTPPDASDRLPDRRVRLPPRDRPHRPPPLASQERLTVSSRRSGQCVHRNPRLTVKYY